MGIGSKTVDLWVLEGCSARYWKDKNIGECGENRNICCGCGQRQSERRKREVSNLEGH